MNRKDFKRNSPGKLTSITPFWGGDVCFEPAPLPPDWSFPARLWPLLSEAGKQLMLLEGISRMTDVPNPALLLGPLQDREAILSSRIEGTYATPRQLLLYELNPPNDESETDETNQHREVANYARALAYGAASELPLSLPLLRQLHAILMDGVRGEDKEPGQFRRRQVAIGANARFVPPSPQRLHDSLEHLNAYLQRENREYDPLVECFLVHYQFETIHPFADGNGRVGRLLLTLMIQRWCGLSHPSLHMSEYFERDHLQYCQLMYRVSTLGGWFEWVEYCLEGVVQQARQTTNRCERLERLRLDFKQRVLQHKRPRRLTRIAEKLFHSPAVTIAEVAKEVQVTYPTAKADVEKLVDMKILQEIPDRHPKTYYAPEIFDIAYEGLE